MVESQEANAVEFSMCSKVKHAHYPCSRSNLCEHNYLTMIKADVFFSTSVGSACCLCVRLGRERLSTQNNTTETMWAEWKLKFQRQVSASSCVTLDAFAGGALVTHSHRTSSSIPFEGSLQTNTVSLYGIHKWDNYVIDKRCRWFLGASSRASICHLSAA